MIINKNDKIRNKKKMIKYATRKYTLWSILFETILDHAFLHVPRKYGANI